MEYTDRSFMEFVDGAPTAFHAVAAAGQILAEHGFEALDLGAHWELRRGGKYYVVSNDAYLCAFTLGAEMDPGQGCRIGVSHSDSPCFRIKHTPEVRAEGYLCLDTEAYGGIQLASFQDRPLSIAGRVVCRSEDPLHPDVRLMDCRRPVVLIANVAPHISAEQSKGERKVSRMYPILDVGGDESPNAFRRFIGAQIGVAPEDILDYELSVYNCAPCTTWGANETLVAAPRLDNLTSFYALLCAITDQGNPSGIQVAIAYDHEEIGNRSKCGANSNLTEHVLKRIYLGLGYDEETYMAAMHRSLIFSLDAAHAYHPLYGEHYDKNSHCVMGRGVCLKEASSQSFATDSVMSGIVEQLCRKENIPLQKYANHSDIRGGGTIGPVISALLGANTADLGVPMLSMHSAVESMALADEAALSRLMRAFYQA